MYDHFLQFVDTINEKNIMKINFKSNPNYQSILEHVTFEIGQQYLRLLENEFKFIEMSNIIEYLNLNDACGSPQLNKYTTNNGVEFVCSPSSLRYVYHALTILDYYKNTKCKKMVEVGCGYGGLFLAVCHFSKLLNIEINKYYIIDLEPVGKMIKAYLSMHKSNITIDYSIHPASLFGIDIYDTDLFLISNYCFTEINIDYRDNYIRYLFPNCSSGFIIWQTCFNYNICEAKHIVPVKKIQEETPQTAGDKSLNYFVYF